MRLGIFLALLAVSWATLPQQKSSSRAREQQPPTTERGTDSVPLAVKLLNTGKSEADAAQEAERVHGERAATRANLALAGVSLLATFVTLGFLVYQTKLLRQTVTASDEANRINRDAILADQRAWILPAFEFTSGWRWTPDGSAHVTVLFLLKNIGRVPAIGVWVNPVIYPQNEPFPKPSDEQRRLAALGRERVGQIAGLTIFPGETERLAMGLTLRAEDVEKQRAWLTEAHGGTLDMFTMTPVIVGSITYQSALEGPAVHETGFILEVDTANPRRFDPALGDISTPFLHLSPSQLYRPLIT